VIPEIDIWRAANLMLKRYCEKALEESSTSADELAADGDYDGAVTWRRITNAVVQLANTVPRRGCRGRAGNYSGRGAERRRTVSRPKVRDRRHAFGR
jgi:hypothetical protein